MFAVNDRMAVAAIGVLKAAGRKIPDDVAVIGVDGSEAGELSTPTLTSVSGPTGAMGEGLAQLMLDAIAGRPAKRLVFPTHLIKRDST